MTAVAKVEIPEKVTKATLRGDMDRWVPQLQPFCTRDFTPDRLIAGAVQAAINTPDLYKCTPGSLFLALVRCARLRLDVGESGMWLVPLNKKGTMTCEAWIDYRGLKVLAKRQRLIRHMDEVVVWAGDDFDVELGLHPRLTHRPVRDPSQRGAMIGAYSRIERPSSPVSFHWLEMPEIEARRAKSKSWSQERVGKCPPWWAMKAVVRDYLGRQPKTPEILLALASDDTPEFDPDTGEVLASDPTEMRAAEIAAELDQRAALAPPAPTTEMASEKQVTLLRRLMSSSVWTDDEKREVEMDLAAGLSKVQCSARIEAAMETLALRKAGRAKATATDAESEVADVSEDLPF